MRFSQVPAPKCPNTIKREIPLLIKNPRRVFASIRAQIKRSDKNVNTKKRIGRSGNSGGTKKKIVDHIPIRRSTMVSAGRKFFLCFTLSLSIML